jgi:hypothetical protein
MSQNEIPQPNWKLPLILSAILAAGGSLVYWYQYDKKPKQEKAETQNKKPLALPTDSTQIAMIKVKSGKGLIELKCESLSAKTCTADKVGTWKVTHPVELVADHENVKEFLTNATGLLATETISLKEDSAEKRKSLLDEYGLSPEKRTDLNTRFVELVAEDGKRYTAWFGAEHPLGEKLFAGRAVDGQMQEETIFVVSNYYQSNLDKNLTYFRDKQLFNFSRGDVESFEATTSYGKLTGKKVDGLWQINNLPGEHERIETALGSIAKTMAKEFPIPADTQGGKSLFAYTLKTKDKTFSISVTEKSDKNGTKHYYAKSSTRPEVVEIDSVLETQVNKKLNDFRKQTVFGETEKVTATLLSVDLPSAKTTLAFELKNGSWTARDTGQKLDTSKAQALLDQLAQTRIQNFLTKLPAGKVDSMIVTIADDKNPNRFKFRFSQIGDKLYGQDLNSTRAEAFELSEALKTALPFQPDAWKLKQ